MKYTTCTHLVQLRACLFTLRNYPLKKIYLEQIYCTYIQYTVYTVNLATDVCPHSIPTSKRPALGNFIALIMNRFLLNN